MNFPVLIFLIKLIAQTIFNIIIYVFIFIIIKENGGIEVKITNMMSTWRKVNIMRLYSSKDDNNVHYYKYILQVGHLTYPTKSDVQLDESLGEGESCDFNNIWTTNNGSNLKIKDLIVYTEGMSYFCVLLASCIP